MSIFTMEYLGVLLFTGAGILVGAVLAGWLVRNRLMHAHEQQLAAARIEQSIVQEKLLAHQQTIEQLHVQAAQSREEMRVHQQRNADLQASNAALEVGVRRVPFVEKELAHFKEHCDGLQAELRRESAALAQAVEKASRLAKVEAEKVQQEEQLATLQQHLSQHKTQLAELRTILEEERKQSVEKIALLNDARDQLKNEFQNLANRIFEEKSIKFADQNRTAVDHLLRPLHDQIGEFKRRVEDVYDKESRDRTALHAEIHHLKELNQRIGQEALNLTRALKGDSKARGNWGEVILERVLEASGLQKGREYDVQVCLRDEAGKRYQPDVLVRLPEGKHIIIDAKVSLKAYEAYYCCEDVQEKEQYLSAHIESMRTHIRMLSAKSYEALEGLCSLDFTLIFVPIEAAFLAAVEKDSSLFSEAFEKNILVVSPSTLLVTLRTIQNIWRHEYQNRNALEIAKKAGGLYDKFVGFVESLQEVGRQLEKAREAYQSAHSRLVDGKGNLVRRSQELRDLGVKAGKKLPLKLLDSVDWEKAEDVP
ncbi:MAG: DNA recombination protein RmuC [Desulfobacteraceae bacterium]|nr:MAG: DNA recombination protein RmuC [Desulfobacteraceae bacterium]